MKLFYGLLEGSKDGVSTSGVGVHGLHVFQSCHLSCIFTCIYGLPGSEMSVALTKLNKLTKLCICINLKKIDFT